MSVKPTTRLQYSPSSLTLHSVFYMLGTWGHINFFHLYIAMLWVCTELAMNMEVPICHKLEQANLINIIALFPFPFP
jgi:hypothetical protein